MMNTAVLRGVLVAGVVGFGLAIGAEDQPKARVDPLGDPLPPEALLRIGTTRHRVISGGVKELADGKTFLFNSSAGFVMPTGPRPPSELRWMDATTGRVFDTWVAPDEGIFCGTSADGRLAVVVHGESIRLWDVTNRKVVRTLEGKSNQHLSVYFSRDSRVIVGRRFIPAPSGTIRAWDTETGRELWPEEKWKNARWQVLGFTPDDKAVVVVRGALVPGNWNYSVRVLECATGKELREIVNLFGHENGDWTLSPDGRVLAGQYLRTAQPSFWDVPTGKQRDAVKELKGPLRILEFSKDGKTFVTHAEGAEIQVWDWPSGLLRRRLDIGSLSWLSRFDLMADGKRARFTSSQETAMRFLDLDTGKVVIPSDVGHLGRVNCVAVSADGGIVSGGLDATIRVWDGKTGQQAWKIVTSHDPGPSKLALSADGQVVASASGHKGTVAVHEPRTGQLLRTLDTGLENTVHLAFAPHGQVLAILGREKNPKRKDHVESCLMLWDAGAGRLIRRLEGGGAQLDTIQFSPDGRRLIGAEGFQVRIWDVATGRLPREFFMEKSWFRTVSPDGRTLVFGTQKETALVERATEQVRALIQPDYPQNTLVRFAPNGRFLALTGPWRVEGITLVDVLTGQLIHTYPIHDGGVMDLAFTSDGRALVSAGHDTTLLVWDVAGVLARQPKEPRQPSPEEVATAWKALAGNDAKAAYSAISVLVAASDRSVLLLREHLRPASAVDPKQVNRWLASLDSTRFAEREEAVRQLARHPGQVESALRRALSNKPTAEARQRAEKVLVTLEGPVSDGERLKYLRALEVLEYLGTVEARHVLKTLAGGAAEAELTREARVALDRLTRARSPTAPR